MTGWVTNSVDPNLSFRVSVIVCKVFNEVDLATRDRALDSKVVFLPTLFTCCMLGTVLCKMDECRGRKDLPCLKGYSFRSGWFLPQSFVSCL